MSLRPLLPPPAQRCQRDEDCGGENICEAGACKPIQIRTNVLYLYYRDGAFREALLLYWARKSNPGYTVVAPVYWHYWSPSSETKIVAPFYWHFEDRLQRSTVTWVTLAVYTHDARGSGFGLMPLFYASSRRQLGGADPGHVRVPRSRDAQGVRRGGVSLLVAARRRRARPTWDSRFSIRRGRRPAPSRTRCR